MNVNELKRKIQQDLDEARELLRLEAEVRHHAKQDLAVFTRLFWDCVEPGRRFFWNWHLDAICEHLMGITLGCFNKLIINVPPRTTKSITTSVMWQPWTWWQDEDPEHPSDLIGPRSRWLTGSHSELLSVRDVIKSRRLMDSPDYAAGRRFDFTQDTKTQFENTKTGMRMAFGTLTGVTGQGGDILSLDDPHSAVEGMFSKADREKVLETWDMQIANRVSDPVRSARVITMQRLHVNDLVGHILSRDHGWVVLNLPMEATPDKCRTIMGFEDPREPGELLWKERFPREVVDAEKLRLGAYGTSSQLQQRPSPAGGVLIPVDKIFRVKSLPPYRFAFLCADTAQKDKEINDPWAIGAFIVTDDERIILADLVSKRMMYPAGKAAAKDLWNKWKLLDATVFVIEDKSSGSSLIQEFNAEGVPTFAVSPSTDKVVRMAVETPKIESGHFGVLDGQPWITDYLAELGGFPDYATKDRVDMTSMALLYLRKLSSQHVTKESFEGWMGASTFAGVADYGTEQQF